MKRSPSRSTSTPKKQNFTKKHKSARLVHIADLSTAVVEVAIKVVNKSLTQNQLFQNVTPPLTHVGIPRPRNETLN